MPDTLTMSSVFDQLAENPTVTLPARLVALLASRYKEWDINAFLQLTLDELASLIMVASDDVEAGRNIDPLASAEVLKMRILAIKVQNGVSLSSHKDMLSTTLWLDSFAGSRWVVGLRDLIRVLLIFVPLAGILYAISPSSFRSSHSVFAMVAAGILVPLFFGQIGRNIAQSNGHAIYARADWSLRSKGFLYSTLAEFAIVSLTTRHLGIAVLLECAITIGICGYFIADRVIGATRNGKFRLIAPPVLEPAHDEAWYQAKLTQRADQPVRSVLDEVEAMGSVITSVTTIRGNITLRSVIVLGDVSSVSGDISGIVYGPPEMKVWSAGGTVTAHVVHCSYQTLWKSAGEFDAKETVDKDFFGRNYWF